MSIDRRQQHFEEAEQREKEDFLPKLAALKTVEEAKKLWLSAPLPNDPGRKYYANLGFFLDGYRVPDRSSWVELMHYITFIKRLQADGKIEATVAARVLEELNKSLEDKH